MVDDESTPRWARDPTGRYDYRYWDGSGWTGHVVNGLLPTEAPSARMAAAPATRVDAPAGAATPRRHDAATTGEIARTRSGRSEREPLTSTLSRRAFWMGALAGGVVVLAAAFAVGAWRDTSSSDSPAVTANTAPVTAPAATATTASPGRPPQQVKVMIINSSGVSGAATTKSEALQALGYPNAGLTNGTQRNGTAVQCRAGFELEAVALAKNIGTGILLEPFPDNPPPGAVNADCLVVLGK